MKKHPKMPGSSVSDTGLTYFRKIRIFQQVNRNQFPVLHLIDTCPMSKENPFREAAIIMEMLSSQAGLAGPKKSFDSKIIY